MTAAMYTIAVLLYLWLGSGQTRRIVRIRNDPLRVGLMMLTYPGHAIRYPASYLAYCLELRQPPYCLLTRQFWILPVVMFLAGCDGVFVPEETK